MSQGSALDIGGGIIAHVGPDDGPPVLWIHGYSLAACVWRDLWRRLPAWQHIGVDLPGHGCSASARPGLTLVELARDIGRFAEHRGVRRLVGLSFGGMVALQVAIEYSGQFVALVLGAPALGGGPHDRHAQARNLELRRLYGARGRGPWMTDLWMTSPPDIFKGASRQPALWSRLRQIVEAHSWSELADDRMQPLTTHVQGRADLERIGASTLVLVGDEDAHAFKRCAELIRRAIPQCRRIYLEQTGHLTLLERPDTLHAVLDGHFRADVSIDRATSVSQMEEHHGRQRQGGRSGRREGSQPHDPGGAIECCSRGVRPGLDGELHPARARTSAGG